MSNIYRTNKDFLTAEEIKEYIEDYKLNEVPRLKMLEDYYIGKHAIIKREKGDKLVNNKLVNPYAKYITDMLTGYFIGQPVTYTAVSNESDQDDLLLENLVEIFKANDEQEKNLERGKICSKQGRAYELIYINEDTEPRIANLSPLECFIIYDNSIEPKKKFAIRFYNVSSPNDTHMEVEVYDKNFITYYTESSDGGLVEGDSYIHNFSDVPIIETLNNQEALGDYEPVISLIDAYDKAQSDTANDMEQFTDAYLVLVNLAGTKTDDILRMKEQKVLEHNENGEAKWLIKEVNDTWVENYKNRIKTDIHKFSATPDMTDSNFGQNLSGVSLRYKLLAMEQIRVNKERKFKKALQERIKLLTSFLQKINSNLELDENLYTSIDIQFNNTLPQNIDEIAGIIEKLSPYLSTETLIELLPFVENAREEIKKKENEDQQNNEEFDYSSFFNVLNEEKTLESDLDDEEK